MAKFINSQNAIPTDLLLWNERPTQVSIQETYNIKVWPITNILNDGPINFNVPPQPKGMMTDINVVTKFKIQYNGQDMTASQSEFSVVNNFANSLWSLVNVTVDDRVDLMQSMKNSYAYQTFFNHALNSESSHQDYLFYNELFKMDEAETKILCELDTVFWKYNPAFDTELNTLISDAEIETGDIAAKKAELKQIMTTWWKKTSRNRAASDRLKRLDWGRGGIVNAKLQCPILNTAKCLPTNMKIRISLTKNSDEFLLLAKAGSKYSIFIEDIYLDVTYYRPRDQILQIIEDRLQKDAAPYFVSRPEIIIKPITHSSRIIRLTDVFHDKMPSYAFFCLQKSSDFEGKLTTNPFVFVPFKKFQFYVNGSPYFTNPLELSNIDNTGHCYEFGEYLRQLYRTIGKDLKGDCLVNSNNFVLNFMVGISFGADRSSTAEKHLNLQEKGSTYLEIDMGINDSIPEDLILITYAVFDRQVQIDGDRKVTIIE